MAILEVKNLYKNFGETQFLKGVYFEMNKGFDVPLEYLKIGLS